MSTLQGNMDEKTAIETRNSTTFTDKSRRDFWDTGRVRYAARSEYRRLLDLRSTLEAIQHAPSV